MKEQIENIIEELEDMCPEGPASFYILQAIEQLQIALSELPADEQVDE